ncbi:MAG: JAB domain-containing protein [Limosilactobacillus sp.]|uniref:JAB domain-containing protein n=1 Tax=Limosilactobacillus sp. TaxID=2773925 RepID=UPI0027071889|nr:JAB domain-containing protein [Limosilactobacillus sp.]
MDEQTTGKYLDLLVRSISADNIDRSQELFLNFLEKFPTPLKVKQMSRDDRKKVLDWGPEMRSMIAGIELGQLVAKSHYEIVGHAYSSAMLGKEMIDQFQDEEQECVAIAYTDVHNDIIDIELLFRGGHSECMLYPDRIFSSALRQSATGIVMIHNHPSGDVEPSPQDLNFAKRLESGCQILGLQMLDFLIVGHDNYYSWREKQQIQEEK